MPDYVSEASSPRVGNDGGFYKNHVASGQELDNGGWGLGNQTGFNTLLPYDVAMANDGTVYAGLQDNGHMKIEPDGRPQYMVYGGDGYICRGRSGEQQRRVRGLRFNGYERDDRRRQVVALTSTSGLRTPASSTRSSWTTWIRTTSSRAGTRLRRRSHGPDTEAGTTGDNAWSIVYDLGTQQRPGDMAATPSATDPANGMSAIDVRGSTTYAAYCGVCDTLNATAPFKSGIATNAGGAWHIASAAGLPERFITAVKIDSTDATGKTIYVTLGGYSRRWIPPGTLHDQSPDAGTGHLFKSTDGGETFVDISGNLPDAPATTVEIRNGTQLIVGTDVGVFATALAAGTTFAPLHRMPVTPISMVNLKPNDPNLLVVATYGRGVWTYSLTTTVPGGGTTPPAERPPAPAGIALAGPFGFELDAQGWDDGPVGQPAARLEAGGSGSRVDHELPADAVLRRIERDPDLTGGESPRRLGLRRLPQPAGHGAGLRLPDRPVLDERDDLDGRKRWIWDPVTNDWSDQLAFDGQNAGYPAFAAEKVAFNAPAGSLQIRFRFASDQLISSPLYTGVHVDDVAIGR